MEFQYQALSCIIKRAFEKSTFHVKSNFKANFYIIFYNWIYGTLPYVTLAIFWLWMICLFNYGCTKSLQKIKGIQIGLDFMLTNLTVVFVGFLLQPTNQKVCAKINLNKYIAEKLGNLEKLHQKFIKIGIIWRSHQQFLGTLGCFVFIILHGELWTPQTV